jgi:hypothetical protein
MGNILAQRILGCEAASELAGKLAAASLFQTMTPEGVIPQSDRSSASAWPPVERTNYGNVERSSATPLDHHR